MADAFQPPEGRESINRRIGARGLRAAGQRPEDALDVLAGCLRDEDSVISPCIGDPREAPVLGLLAAAGPRAAEAPGEYALIVESVREGYLLHYDRPRVVVEADPDLALLAGDYLYALGLERLAWLGDLEAVRELSDLISLCARVGAEPSPPRAGGALWLGSVAAVAAGGSEAHERAKDALRAGRPQAVPALAEAAEAAAGRAGINEALRAAAQSIDFALPNEANLG